MFLLDFSLPPSKAFARGFLKGMAAPAYLYHVEDEPALPQAMMLTVSQTSVADSLSSDWRTVGLDFDKVIDSYGKEATASR